jgi:hypothetical protein
MTLISTMIWMHTTQTVAISRHDVALGDGDGPAWKTQNILKEKATKIQL